MSDAPTPDLQDITAGVVRALVLYSLAEFQSGPARTLRVTAEAASFSVADDGRGHAIERNIAGAPYLKFIYTHLDYPFASDQGAPVQLQGIGMSLINALCSELEVTVRKRDATLRMSFRNGHLCGGERLEAGSEATGNTVSGTVSPQIRGGGVHVRQLQAWLLGIVAANPSLKLLFNGRELHADPQSET